MVGLNKTFFIGRLGQDPELRSTATGTPLVRLSVATPHSRKVGEEWKEETDWHKVVAFGGNAEYLARYAHKGDALAIECTVRENKWTDKENKTHFETSIICERVLWLFSKPKTLDAPGTTAVPMPPAPEPAADADNVDEIPF